MGTDNITLLGLDDGANDGATLVGICKAPGNFGGFKSDLWMRGKLNMREFFFTCRFGRIVSIHHGAMILS
jgi:hypothetical protein